MIKSEHIGTFVRTKSRRFKDESNGCYLCWKTFPNVDLLRAHLCLHLHSVVVKNCNASWKPLRNDDASLICNVELMASRLIFHIQNNTTDDVKILFIGVFNDILQFGKLNPNEFPLIVNPGETVHLTSPIFGLCDYNHYIIVYDDAQRHFERVQSYFVELKIDNMRMTVQEVEDEEYIDATELFKEAPEDNWKNAIDGPEIIAARRLPDVLKIMPLPWYEPTPEVKELCIISFQTPALRFKPTMPYNRIYNLVNRCTELRRNNYFEMLSLIIQIEDFTARLAIDKHTKHNRQLIGRSIGEFAVKLHPDEGRPLFLTTGDNVWVGHKDNPDMRIRGYVKKVTSSEILLKLRNSSVVEQSPSYSIHFEVNRLTFQMERKALDDAYHLNIIDYLFPAEQQIEKIEYKLPQLQFFDPKIKSDVNQIAAVKHIVAGTAYPHPYLLIGYPGTGKTKVIVESVCQLFTFPENRILICSSCNTVCDEISTRLIKFLKSATQYQTPTTQQYNILRLYATSVRVSCKDYDLLSNHSNFDEKSIPCLEEIYKYRIVVCTLTVAGRLAQGQINKNHFTHLFIDECESATESYTLVPIVGICSSYNSINANIILTGDPQQLGPIMRNNILRKTQLNRSMFMRLYSSWPYERDTKSRDYNQRFISKLKNNYRSHPKLVAVPNLLFYSNEIRSSANPAHFKWFSEMDFLPNKGFPIVFEDIDGQPERMADCLSWYNHAESLRVMFYVKQLLGNETRKVRESDVGIISPYKRQCVNIEEMLAAEQLTKIEVGSVEQFQGKEKSIIIISTVRKGKMGFVLERERINVMITRAMGLLIIIGHKETLMKNADWSRVINYTYDNCVKEPVTGPDMCGIVNCVNEPVTGPDMCGVEGGDADSVVHRGC